MNHLISRLWLTNAPQQMSKTYFRFRFESPIQFIYGNTCNFQWLRNILVLERTNKCRINSFVNFEFFIFAFPVSYFRWMFMVICKLCYLVIVRRRTTKGSCSKWKILLLHKLQFLNCRARFLNSIDIHV